MDSNKKYIRQDLQDYLDRGALGYLTAGEKKSHKSSKSCQKKKLKPNPFNTQCPSEKKNYC